LVAQIDCTGCSACSQVCPKECITMTFDAKGFLYPVINEALCVSCGKCKTVCPPNIVSNNINRGYACTLKERSQLANSTSGGMFYAIAKYVLELGGIVYGVAYDREMNVIHQAVDNEIDLEKLRKSKYVQSEIGNSFKEIKQHLIAGKKVLFSGTPCQVAGLVAYLGRSYENLLTVQVFCSGVISKYVWDKYIEHTSNRIGHKIIAYESRHKKVNDINTDRSKQGWKNPYIYIQTDDNQKHILPREKDILTIAYANHLVTRPSCSNCKFKLKADVIYADMSIGDFWGCENSAPFAFDELGVSAVIVHTEKGLEILNSLDAEINTHEVEVNAIYNGNPGACYSYKDHPYQKEFFNELSKGKRELDDLILQYVGFGLQFSKKAYKFGIFGSYNLRASVNELCAYSNSKLEYQYSNCSIPSLFSAPLAVPDNMLMPGNPFRKKMVLADFSKEFLDVLLDGQIDYLLINLLEDRFGVMNFGGSLITPSEALGDTNCLLENVIEPTSFCMWEDKYDNFVDFLNQHVSGCKIILVKEYLAEVYENQNGELEKYSLDQLSKIKEINEYLKEGYSVLERKVKGVHVVEIQDTKFLYTQFAHRYGMHPWNLNNLYYKEIAKSIVALLDC